MRATPTTTVNAVNATRRGRRDSFGRGSASSRSASPARTQHRSKGGMRRSTSLQHTVAAAAVDAPAPARSEILEAWRACEAVAFDVDSTVCTDEGIDELGAYCGKKEEVEAITRKAMEGGMPFGEALQLRLEAMSLSRDQLAEFVRQHPPKYSPGIKELVNALRDSGKEVYLVSGGFRQMIKPVAEGLGIPMENVHANTITFDESGALTGYDPKEFPSKAGGKAEAVKYIKSSRGFKTMAMVGDGATDVEARVPGGADIVVGYGGSQRRANVEAAADWFVLDLNILREALTTSSG